MKTPIEMLPNQDPIYLQMKEKVLKFNYVYQRYLSLTGLDFAKIGAMNVHVVKGNGDKPYMYSLDGKTEFGYDIDELTNTLLHDNVIIEHNKVVNAKYFQIINKINSVLSKEELEFLLTYMKEMSYYG